MTLKYKITCEIKHKIEMPQGASMKPSINLIKDVSMKVINVDDIGVATIEVALDSINLEKEAFQRKTSFDYIKLEDIQKAKAEIPIFALLAGMVGKPITITITSLGEIKELKGLNKLTEEVKKEFEMENNPRLAELKDIYSEESVKKMLQRCFGQLPEEEITKGDPWETSMEMPLEVFLTVKIKGKNSYTGKQTVDKKMCAKIDTNEELTFLKAPRRFSSPMYEAEWEAIRATSTYYFALKEGILVRSESHWDLKGILPPEMMGEDATIKHEVILKTELVKVK